MSFWNLLEVIALMFSISAGAILGLVFYKAIRVALDRRSKEKKKRKETGR